jgi:hypothetical protein
MSELVSLLDELTDLMKIVAPVVTMPLAASLLWVGKPLGPLPKGPKKVMSGVLLMMCALIYAIGAGSCVLGGFIQGSALCSFRTRRGPWDAVNDFYSVQAVWSSVFLLALFVALLCTLALLPGKVTGWQRFLFLATAGRRGAWRESAPAAKARASDEAYEELRRLIKLETNPERKAELIAVEGTLRAVDQEAGRLVEEMNESIERMDELSRAIRVVAWITAISFPVISVGLLMPVIVGAVTHETFSLRHAAIVFLGVATGLGAFHAVRLLRSG